MSTFTAVGMSKGRSENKNYTVDVVLFWQTLLKLKSRLFPAMDAQVFAAAGWWTWD